MCSSELIILWKGSGRWGSSSATARRMMMLLEIDRPAPTSKQSKRESKNQEPILARIDESIEGPMAVRAIGPLKKKSLGRSHMGRKKATHVPAKLPAKPNRHTDCDRVKCKSSGSLLNPVSLACSAWAMGLARPASASGGQRSPRVALSLISERWLARAGSNGARDSSPPLAQ